MPKTIYVVRHGQSESNIGPIRQGIESPLTERGREEAAFVARRIKTLPAEALISSPYVRARETAEIIAAETGLPIEYSDLLTERRMSSELKGIPHKDPLNVRVNKLIRENFHLPGWRHSDEENFDDLKKRAGDALSFLENRPEQNILVVSHGMFARVLLARVIMGEDLTGLECEHFIRSLRMKNTALTVLRFDGEVQESQEGGEAPWKVLTWADYAHLAETDGGFIES